MSQRRIVLEDSEIHFFEKLEDLSFTQQKSGLWLPPEGIATGAVIPQSVQNNPPDPPAPMLYGSTLYGSSVMSNRPPYPVPDFFHEEDVSLRLSIIGRGNLPQLQFAFAVREYITWNASPDAEIAMSDGRRLRGFVFHADIR